MEVFQRNVGKLILLSELCRSRNFISYLGVSVVTIEADIPHSRKCDLRKFKDRSRSRQARLHCSWHAAENIKAVSDNPTEQRAVLMRFCRPSRAHYTLQVAVRYYRSARRSSRLCWCVP
ncbi:hypothetical protein U1Q18_051466 [Sarracenia purpurea var. burkii]